MGVCVCVFHYNYYSTFYKIMVCLSSITTMVDIPITPCILPLFYLLNDINNQ